MIFDMTDDRVAWQSTQARKVPYTWPFVGVQLPSRAMTMTERNIRENPSDEEHQHHAAVMQRSRAGRLTVNGAKASHKPQGIAISDKKA